MWLCFAQGGQFCNLYMRTLLNPWEYFVLCGPLMCVAHGAMSIFGCRTCIISICNKSIPFPTHGYGVKVTSYHFLTLIDISPPAILYFWIWSHQGQKNQEKRGSKMFQFLYWNFLYSCLAMKTIDKGGLCSGLWNSNKIMIICALWSFVMLMMMMMMVMMMIGQKKNNLIEGKARGCAQLGSLHRALMELEFPNRVKIENVKISCGI